MHRYLLLHVHQMSRIADCLVLAPVLFMGTERSIALMDSHRVRSVCIWTRLPIATGSTESSFDPTWKKLSSGSRVDVCQPSCRLGGGQANIAASSSSHLSTGLGHRGRPGLSSPERAACSILFATRA